VPRIPRPDPNDFRYKKKTPLLTNKDKFAIVCDALIAATENRTSGEATLTPSPKNQLAKLYRYETLTVLKAVAEQSKHAFAINESNYGKEPIPDDEREGILVLPGVITTREPAYRPAPLPEDVPITLTLFSRFNNWRETTIHKRKITLADLTPTNRTKIREVILDIDERFQLNSSPKIRLEWSPGNPARDHDARKDALDFLKNKGVVENFEFYYSKLGVGSSIQVEINIEKFQRFMAELLKIPKNQFSTDAPEPEAAPPSRKQDSSKPFQRLRWEAITIQFLDGHNVKISGQGIRKHAKAHFKEMGFEDGRNLKPDNQWLLLQELAESQGELSWQNSRAERKIKKKKQLLSETLQGYFGIKDNPFYPYKENNSYRIKVNLIPE